MSLHVIALFCREAVPRNLLEKFALGASHCGQVGLAQTSRRLDKRVKYGLKIERRTADDLEYVCGGSLLLQKFAQLVQESNVFDGDDGLGGKILDQLDLLGSEWANLLTVDRDGSDDVSLL